MRKIGKRGQEWHWIIISIILGLLILAISLFFIFREYFSDTDINRENCRQSIILRGGNLSWITKEAQNQFPFKCKTEVLNINYYDQNKAMKAIADELASCWYLYGEGQENLYPESWIFGGDVYCFVCARIHFDPKVVEKYQEPLQIGNYILNKKISGQTYFDYVYGNPILDSAQKEGFKEVISKQMIIPSEGDILITYVYASGNYLEQIKQAHPILSSISYISPLQVANIYNWLTDAKADTGRNMMFFQQKDYGLLSQKCTKIETIPA